MSDDLFLNDGNSNNYISVELKGVQSNINGIGARIEAFGPWGRQIREIRSGEGYGIMNSFNAHFGLGSATRIDRIVVKWPSGITQEINNPGINQFLRVTESAGNNSCIGQACNDNDPCTINDAFDVSCNCSGVLIDSDRDGICDQNDICPGGDDALDQDSDGIPDGCDNCLSLIHI